MSQRVAAIALTCVSHLASKNAPASTSPAWSPSACSNDLSKRNGSDSRISLTAASVGRLLPLLVQVLQPDREIPLLLLEALNQSLAGT